MDKFFDSGNPVMKFLARLVDLAVLNIFTVLYSIPLVTAGGAMAAMNHVLLHLVRKDETYVIRMFKDSFRENFRQSIPEGLLVILIGIITAVDMWALHGSESRLMTLMMIIITIVAVFIFVTAVYMFALQSRYENTVKGTIVNAVRLSLGNLPGNRVCNVIVPVHDGSNCLRTSPQSEVNHVPPRHLQMRTPEP